MKAAIGERLRVLGAQVAPVTGAGFAEQWRRILFRHPLYRKDWDAYGIDRYIIQITGILHHPLAVLFLSSLVTQTYADHELPYGRGFYYNRLFKLF